MTYRTIPRDLIRRAENENFPLISLSALRDLRRALDDLETAAMMRAREMGASTTDIGDALGITRQAAYYRIRHLLDRQPPDAADVVLIPDDEPVHET